MRGPSKRVVHAPRRMHHPRGRGAVAGSKAETFDVLLVGCEEQEENLGLRYIAAYLGARGVRSRVVPYHADRGLELLEIIHRARPRLVGFSLIFQGMLPAFAELIAFLRSKHVHAHFTLGGHFPTIAYDRTMELIPGLDTVCRHEGEATLWELYQALDRPAHWPGIRGLVFRGEGGIVANPPRPRISNLDEMPFPVRRDEVMRMRGVGIASLIASRGCWQRCSFCSVRRFYHESPGPLRRARSPVNVVEEMEWLFGEKGIRIFIFKDDDLPTKGGRARAWISGFADELRKRHLADRIAWRISCRVDDIDYPSLSALKRTGLTWVYLGIESGSERGLRTFYKGYHIPEVYRGLRMLARLGLAFDYGFMLLDPDSDFFSIAESLTFLDHLGRDGRVSVHFTKMFPYVGTPIAERLSAEGRLTGSDDAPDYRFIDPRIDLFQSFCADAFHARNFHPEGTVNRSRLALFDAEILERFFPGEFAVDEYRRSIRNITAEGNARAVSAMRAVLSFLAGRPFEYALAEWYTVSEIVSQVRAQEMRLAADLKEVMSSHGFKPPIAELEQLLP